MLFELGAIGEVIDKFGSNEILAEVTYSTPSIPMFGSKCFNLATTLSHTLTHPAIFATQVTDFKVIGGAAFPIIQKKSICHQNFSSDYWETWEQSARFCCIKNKLISYSGITKHEKFNYSVINLIGNGSYNYAHWLTEFLPQLILLKNASVNITSFKILIDSRSPSSLLESLLWLGVEKDQLCFIAPLTLNEFPESYWVSPLANVVFQRPNPFGENSKNSFAKAQDAIFHPKVIEATRAAYIELLNNKIISKAPEMIYIHRSPPNHKGSQRLVLNSSAIQASLELKGFITIDPSGMSFMDQVSIFSRARVIVAASGAGLVNMMWAPAGAEIVVLMNDSKPANYWYFSNIASALGHKLSFVLGKVIDTGFWKDINHADFHIDMDVLLDLVSKVQMQSLRTNT